VRRDAGVRRVSLICIGADLPSIVWAATRYGVAQCCLIPLFLRGKSGKTMAEGTGRRGFADNGPRGGKYNFKSED
jgi:hypothetical protein